MGSEKLLRTPVRRLRLFGAAGLLATALLLTPVAILTGVLRSQFLTTSGFVAAFGPLAGQPAVQDVLAGRITDELSSTVVPGLVTRSLEAVPGSGALAGNPTITQPLTAGITAILGNRVHAVVSSQAFGSIWRSGIGLAHAQFVATMTGSPDAVLVAGADDTLSISLQPVVAAVRDQLASAGVGFASWIPDTTVSIPVASGTQLSAVQGAYRWLDLLGIWVPVAVPTLLVAGIALSPGRRRATTITAGTIALIGLAIVVAVNLARRAVMASLSVQLHSAQLAGAVYDASTARIVLISGALCVIGSLIWLVVRLLRSGAALSNRRDRS